MKYAGESDTSFDKGKMMEKEIKALQWERRHLSMLKQSDFAKAWSKSGQSFTRGYHQS